MIASLILAYIGFDLIRSNYKNEELTVSKIGFLMFGLSVSIDSLSVGIGLKAITNNYYLSSIVFSLSSLTFTYLGLILGNIIGNNAVLDYCKKFELCINTITVTYFLQCKKGEMATKEYSI